MEGEAMAKQSKLEVILRFIEDKTGITTAKANIGALIDRIKSLKEVGSAVFSELRRGASTFFLPLKAFAVPAIGAVTAALGLAGKALKEFAGQELGEQDVVSALKAMGQYSDQYTQKLIDLASTLQTTTGISDDLWLKSISHLTRFGMNVGNVDKVSEALKNLTGLMDGNIDVATDALSKALQGEFSMFSRFGIVVEQSGDKIQDLDKLISQINTKGADLLEARANTLSGKWTALKNEANEVFEAIGKKLADSLEIGDAITTAQGWLATLTSSVQNGGLGELISKGGKELREHIEGAVKWAEQIATAIKESGKPLDVVFADALRAAAKIFVETLNALVTASMGIWKAIGITIFAAIKDQLLQQDWPKWTGMSNIAGTLAKSTAQRMTPDQAAAYAAKNNIDLAYDDPLNQFAPANTRLAKQMSLQPKTAQAALVSSGSSDQIASSINGALTAMKTAFDGLIAKSTEVINTAAGVEGNELESNYIRVKIPDGEFIGNAEKVQEFIDEIRETDAALADMVQQAVDTQTGANKVQEETKKSLDKVQASHTDVQTTMRAAAAAATATSQTATQTVQVAQQVVAAQAMQAAQLSSLRKALLGLWGDFSV
jgi:hypothetical protein